MNTLTHVGCAALLAAGANMALAGEAVLARNDGNWNPSAFNSCYPDKNNPNTAYWSPAINPASTDGAATDFVVKNGLVLRTPDGNVTMTFGGKSLTLGASDYGSSGSIAYKSNGYKITIPKLIVYKGGLSAATSYDTGGYNTYFAGNATLHTTYESPFTYLFATTQNKKTAYFDFILTGDETTAIKLSGSDLTGRLVPLNSQAGTYSGSWIFGANQYFYVDGGRKVNNVAVFTSSQTVFGKPLSTFNPKSVFFFDGCRFRYEATGRSLSAADNRGITIDDNGTLTFVLVNNIVLDCGYPIAGAGATVTGDGNGTLKLRANTTALLKPQSATKFALVGKAAANGGIEIANGQVLTIGEAATDRVSANGAKLTNAMLCFNVAANGSNAAQLRLSGTLDVTGRIGLGLSAVPSVSATTDIPLLVIDKNASRTFTEADFDPWGVTGAQIPNAEKVVLTTNGDCDQVVSVRVFPYVRSNRPESSVNNQYVCQANYAGHWTPSGVPSDGHSYIVWGFNQLRTGLADGKTHDLPGDLWVFYSANSANGNAGYQSKEAKITFKQARLLDGTSFATAQGANWTMTWTGNCDIRTTPGRAVSFVNWGMKAAIVAANLTGHGRINASCIGDGNYAPYEIRFTGENAGYVGTFCATNISAASANYSRLIIAKEENLGGNPEVFAADAFRLCGKMRLAPTAAMTIDDANRGVTFAANASVDTTSGDVTIKTPVVFAGAFEKAGAGTFAYGEGGVTVAAGAAIAVNGGTMKAEGPDALKGASVSFAAGAVLAVNAGMGALDLTTTTLSKAGSEYLVRIDGLSNGADVAIFASAEAASAFVENARTVKGTGRSKGRLYAEGTLVKAFVTGLGVIVK